MAESEWESMRGMCAGPENQFRRIRDGADELGSGKPATRKGSFVTDRLPSRFGACAKILHRITRNYENYRPPSYGFAVGKDPCAELRLFAEVHRQKVNVG